MNRVLNSHGGSISATAPTHPLPSATNRDGKIFTAHRRSGCESSSSFSCPTSSRAREKVFQSRFHPSWLTNAATSNDDKREHYRIFTTTTPTAPTTTKTTTKDDDDKGRRRYQLESTEITLLLPRVCSFLTVSHRCDILSRRPTVRKSCVHRQRPTALSLSLKHTNVHVHTHTPSKGTAPKRSIRPSQAYDA